MFRDFSDAAKQKLLNYVDEVTANGTWDTVKQWFSNIEPNVQSWLGRLDIQKYVNSVECYYKKILDKNNSTKRQIEEIFSNVQAVDTRYISITGSQTVCGSDIIKLINDLANTIDPNGGNMDMGKMKGVLDADVENIRNAKATVEKTIEEKMLGTEAEGCMNSEDPVNLSTGNFIYEHEDLKVAGEIPLSFHRYYNSKDSRTGVLGRCFLHNYQIALEKEADGTIGVRLADGQINYHDKKGQEYIARNTALEFLKETEQGYILVHPGQENISFDQEGKMLRKEDRNGRGISFFYCEDGKLKKAETDNGSSLTYCYNQRGQLEEVKDWLGTTKIAMDEAGRIASVTDPYGKTVGYEWGSMGKRTAVLYPDGKKTVYEYNEAMQLTAMKIFSGEMREKTIRYSYDEAGRLIGKQLPGRNYTDYRYNAVGKLEEILHKGADKSAVAGNKCKRNERLCV